MNFEKIKKLLEPQCTFDGTDAIYDGKRYPLYSVQGVTNLLTDIANSVGSGDKSKFEVVKSVVEDAANVLYCHPIDMKSVTGYLKAWLQYLNDKDAPLVFSVQNPYSVDDFIVTFEKNADVVIDWGDGTVNAESVHTYPQGEEGKEYKIKFYGKLEDFTKITNNDSGELFFVSNLAPMFIYGVDSEGTAWFYTTKTYRLPGSDAAPYGGSEEFTSSPNEEENYYNRCVIGDKSLPIITEPDLVADINIFSVKIIICQIRGIDYFVSPGEYANLTSLSIQSEDLDSFKKSLTEFNNGNTTATLTVLKGRHQDEAYQWATENGHFASIVKE